MLVMYILEDSPDSDVDNELEGRAKSQSRWPPGGYCGPAREKNSTQ